MAAIPGIPGAGDLIHGGKRLYQAKEALSEGPNGARQHYQATSSGLAQRVRAEEDCIARVKDPATRDALELIRHQDRNLQDDIARQGQKLGRRAKSGSTHGIASKLKWDFITDKSVREHNDRMRPAMDAAMLQLARNNAEQIEASFDTLSAFQQTHFQELKTMSAKILDRLPYLKIQQDPLPVRYQLDNLQPPSMTQYATIAAVPPASEHSIASTTSTTSSTLNITVKTCLEKLTDYCLANDPNIIRRSAFEFVQVIFAVALTTTYQALRSRKTSTPAILVTKDDILHACLLGYVIFSLLGPMRRVPRLITDLSDDSLTLHTALGEELKIPELYWRSRFTLHGYLQHHFENRPGSNWVTRKDYRLLIGDTTGIVIDESKWSAVIRSRMQLTMAFLLSETRHCPKCRSVLTVREKSTKSCITCNKSFSSFVLSSTPAIASGVQAHHYNPSSLRNSAASLHTGIVSFAQEMAKFVHVLLLDTASQPAQHSREDQECPICLDPCENPRTFSCGHSVCKDCFVALCRHALEKTQDAEPRCPHCRTKLIGTRAGMSTAQRSDPTDFESPTDFGSPNASNTGDLDDLKRGTMSPPPQGNGNSHRQNGSNDGFGGVDFLGGIQKYPNNADPDDIQRFLHPEIFESNGRPEGDDFYIGDGVQDPDHPLRHSAPSKYSYRKPVADQMRKEAIPSGIAFMRGSPGAVKQLERDLDLLTDWELLRQVKKAQDQTNYGRLGFLSAY